MDSYVPTLCSHCQHAGSSLATSSGQCHSAANLQLALAACVLQADPECGHHRATACAGCQVSRVLGVWEECVDEVAGYSGLD